MSAESNQIKKPILVFLYGFYIAACVVLIIVIVLFVFEIFTQIVIWKPDFSNQKFFMIPYPLEYNILNKDLIIYTYLFIWLVFSIPGYFIVKKNNKGQLLNAVNEENANTNVNRRIEKMEQSIEMILSYLDSNTIKNFPDHEDNY